MTDRDGNFEIYVMKPDGTGPANLTKHSAGDFWPAWSADGKRIAFATDRHSSAPPGNFEIYVMNADGTGQTRLTDHPLFDSTPAFSPDGKKIAFTSQRDGNLEIYVMNADGSDPRNLTSHPAADNDPVFSPDGTKIAFNSNRDGNAEIYVINADGSAPRRLTDHPGFDFQADFSPDGRRIAFSSNRDGNPEIFELSADGTGVAQITRTAAPTEHFLPAYAPDGGSVFFVRKTSPETLVERDLKTGKEVVLTEGPANSSAPAVQPSATGEPEAAARCRCDRLSTRTSSWKPTVRISKLRVRIGYEFRVFWTMECSGTPGQCEGTIQVVPPRRFTATVTGHAGGPLVRCRGTCSAGLARAVARGTFLVRGAGPRSLKLRKLRGKTHTWVLVGRCLRNGKWVPAGGGSTSLSFDRRGLPDLRRSDLDGDGKRDGKR